MGDSIKKYEEHSMKDLLKQQPSKSTFYTGKAGMKAFDDALKALSNRLSPMTPDEAFEKEKRCPRRKLF